MPALDNSALLIFAFALALLAVIGAAMVYGTYQRHRRDVERLRDDIHELLASGEANERIVVNGRASDFVDIAASVNRLLDKADDDAFYADLREHFSDSEIVELGLWCAENVGAGSFVRTLNIITWNEACQLNPLTAKHSAETAASEG